MRASKYNKKNKRKIKIAILGGSTTDLIKDNLFNLFKDSNFNPDFYLSEYNQFYFEGLKPSKKLISFKPDFIYLHTSNMNIDEFPKIGANNKEVKNLINKTLNKYKSIWENLKKKFNCTIIQNNFEYLSLNSLGNLESTRPYGKINFINNLNSKFFEYSQKTKGLIIQDINLLSAQFGLDRWHNDSFFFNYKYVLSHEAIPILSKNIFNIINSVLGKSKKCLVLDFDNTIWGGVIGEIGWQNIEVGNHSAVGEVYLRFQKYIYELMAKGIIIVGSTKNNYETAISGFKNKSNILKKDHFTIIKANWENKAKNILEISKKLNITLDSMVFIDDSKFERELVKKQLPMVEVPDVGNNPENFIFHLDREKYFEKLDLSKEDLARTDYYKRNIKRETEKVKFKDYNQYLLSLKSKSNLQRFKKNNIERIYQLINKTNQFNLTTKRMSFNEVKNISNNNKFLTISADLTDKFGENGVVSVLIAEIKKKEIDIIQWLMSCRVFNRNLEFAIFDYLIFQCKKIGVNKVKGYYIKTKKNHIVENFYKDLQFKKKIKNNKKACWVYNINKNYKKINKTIKISNEK